MKQVFRIAVYRRLLVAYGLNELTWGIGTVALAVVVYRQTGSALGSTAFFLASQFLPAFLSPLLVARLVGYAPRRLLPVLYGLEALLFGLLAWMTTEFSLVPVLAVALIDGAVGLSARVLARAATVEVLRPLDLLHEGNAGINFAFTGCFMVGPAIGGVVVAAGGSVAALLTNCGLFAGVTLVLATAVGLPESSADDAHEGSAWQRLGKAVAHVRGDPATRAILIVQALGMVVGTISVPIEVVFAQHTLHAGAGGYGAMLSGWGAGAVVGSAAYARWRRRPGRALITLSAAAFTVGFAIIAAAPEIVVAVAGSAVGGFGNGIGSVAQRTMLQEYTPRRWMSLVVSLNESAVAGNARAGLRARRRDHRRDRTAGRDGRRGRGLVRVHHRGVDPPQSGANRAATRLRCRQLARRRTRNRSHGRRRPWDACVDRSGPTNSGVRLGCIDIGSNTTRLLVAASDGRQLRWIHQERAFTRIGHELLERGELGPEKIEEVVGVVAGQLAVARELGADSVRAIATAAIRSATNGLQLADAITAATGLAVEILSGEDEARLAFFGVAMTLEVSPPGELGVVDVGGGSSELVVGTAPDEIRWWASIPLGSAALRHAWLHSDPPTASELAQASQQVHAELNRLTVPSPALAVAVGGSATSLARLAGPVLDATALDGALALLAADPASVIAERFAIDPERARLLPAGLLVLAAVARAFGRPLRVGRGGIREGVLLEAFRG